VLGGAAAVIVTLDGSELQLAAQVGVLRHVRAVLAGRRPAYDFEDEDSRWDVDCRGAVGEYVTAKAKGWHWLMTTAPEPGEGDLGRVQVRTTTHRDGCLILRPRDVVADVPFVLVRELDPLHYDVVGWIMAHDGKAVGAWGAKGKNRPPCWWVEGEDLKPIESLTYAWSEYGTIMH